MHRKARSRNRSFNRNGSSSIPQRARYRNNKNDTTTLHYLDEEKTQADSRQKRNWRDVYQNITIQTDQEEDAMIERMSDNIQIAARSKRRKLDHGKDGAKIVMIDNNPRPQEPMCEDDFLWLSDNTFQDKAAIAYFSAPPASETVSDCDILTEQRIKVTTMRLPKKVPSTGEIIWTQGKLEKTIFKYIELCNYSLAADSKAVAHIKHCKDSDEDVMIVARGDDGFLEIVEKSITDIIQEKQLQTCTLQHPRPKVKKQPEKRDIYQYFARKIEDLKKIEFRSSGIPGQKLNKYLWNQHKHVFGSMCDDKCECTLSLNRLSENVVEEYSMEMRKNMRKKNVEWKPPDELNVKVGFVDYFVPKFVGNLQQEFPAENPHQIYKRLVEMWKLHTRQRRFGLKCSGSCPCKEGWRSVFNMGRSKNENKSSNSVATRPTTERGQTHPRGQQQRASKTNQMSSAAASATKQTTHQTNSTDFVLRRKSNSQPNLADHDRSTSSLLSHIKSGFDVEFDTTKPLGFECKTEHFGDKTKCIVTSVNGAQRKDRRIVPGTVIQATSTKDSSEWYPVASDDDLKKHINEYWKKKSQYMIIEMMNGYQHSEECTHSSQPTSVENNRVENGISDGVSSDDFTSPNEPSTNDTTESEETVPTKAKEPNSGILQVPKYSGPVSSSTSSVTANQRPEDSVFRKIAGVPKRTIPKRVNFAADLKRVKYFNKDLPVSKLINESTTPVVDPCPTPSTKTKTIKTSADDLIRAIKKIDCQKLFQVLQQGADVYPLCYADKPPVAVARGIKVFLEDEVKKLERNGNVKAKLIQKKHEHTKATLNYTLMKIFKRSNAIMERARIMKEWKSVRFNLQNLMLTFNQKHKDVWHGHVMTCDVGNTGKWQQVYTQAVTDQNISLEQDQSTAIAIHINPSDRRARKTVFLRLMLSQGYGIDGLEIARKSIDWEDILQHGRKNCNVQFDDISSPYISKILINLNCHVEKSIYRIDEVCQLCATETRDLLNDIIAYNKDENRQKERLGKLDVNMKEYREPHSSLLHAAVYISDPELVKQLLDVGAKQILSNRHTPKSLTELLIEGGAAIEHKMKEMGTWDETSREAKEQKKRNDILDIFRQYDHSANNEEATTNQQNPSVIPHNAHEPDDELSVPEHVHRHTNAKLINEIHPLWFLHEHERCQTCHFFGSRKGCNRGLACPFHHIHNFSGLSYHEDESQLRNVKTGMQKRDVIFECARHDGNVHLYTAAYKDRQTGIFFKSEHGACVHKSNCLYWYDCEDECFEALQMVMAAYIVRNGGPMHDQRSKHNHYGPHAMAVNAENEEQSTAETSFSRPTDNQDDSLYAKLLQSDLDNMYEHIFGASIQDGGWKITEHVGTNGNKTYHALLKIERNSGEQTGFMSTSRFAIHDVDGHWYHGNMKKAKTSAFVQLMEYCRNQEIISKDMLHSEYTGEELPF